jgi:hypothetical protein
MLNGLKLKLVRQMIKNLKGVKFLKKEVKELRKLEANLRKRVSRARNK